MKLNFLRKIISRSLMKRGIFKMYFTVKDIITKLIQWIMFGFHLFAPKCLVKEIIYFKFHHRLYVTKHYDTGVVEMWCHDVKLSNKTHTSLFLGAMIGKVWDQPKRFHTYDFDWDVKRATLKLHQMLLKEIDSKDREVYDLEMKIKKKDVVHDREYFVNQGKKGVETVRAKYGKSPVQIRWARFRKEKKLSTE